MKASMRFNQHFPRTHQIMKTLNVYLIATLLTASSTFAQQAASAYSISSLPSAPAGVNSAIYPMPRLDYLFRVKATNEKAQSQNKKAPIAIVFDGDSITDGWQGKGRAVWTARYEKLNAFDFGISGDKTEQVLWRLSQGQVDGLHPKLILLMIGTNNLASNTVQQIAEAIGAIIAEYRKRCPDSVILVQGIFPRGQMPSDPARAKIKGINEIIARLADGKKVVYLDFGDKFLNADGSMSPEIMDDFLHPTPKGYEIWADAIQPVIDQYVGK